MSLLSTERVLLGLSPGRVSALLVSGRVRHRLLRQRLTPVAGDGPLAWEAELGAVEALLAEQAWAGRELVVVLSCHYVRHAIIPAGAELGEEDLTRLAGIVFADVFGDLAGDWELRVSPSRTGKATVASGVPRGLLERLAGICRTQGRLRSIQPVLMAVFNRIRRAIGRGPAALALLEDGRITVAALEDGEWRHVASRAGSGAMLPLLLEEDALLQQRPAGGALWLCDLTAGGLAPPPGERWRPQQAVPPRLSGVAAGPELRLALWGAA